MKNFKLILLLFLVNLFPVTVFASGTASNPQNATAGQTQGPDTTGNAGWPFAIVNATGTSLDVNLSSISSGFTFGTPANGFTSPGSILQSQVFPQIYNGSTWDLIVAANEASNTTGTGLLGAGILYWDGSKWQLWDRTVGLNTGTNSIGTVGLNTGTNSIGTVGLNTGTNSIGTVGLNAGTNTIGKVDQGVGGSSAWKVDGSAVTQPISAASLPLPTGASTEATLAKLPLAQASSTSGQNGVLSQGAVTTAAPSYTTAQTSPLSLTTTGLLRVDGSGVTQPVSGTVTTTPPANQSVNVAQVAGTTTDTNSGSKSNGTLRVVLATDQPALTNALKVDGSGVTQPVSGTVTANIGTSGSLALDASVTGLHVSQGSTTSGQNGDLIQGAVTTSAPTYTTAKTNPLSLTTAGGLRVDGSGVTQPVSGTVTTNQGNPNAGGTSAWPTSPWFWNGASFEQSVTANAADGTTGDGLAGFGEMVWDGTKWQKRPSFDVNATPLFITTPIPPGLMYGLRGNTQDSWAPTSILNSLVPVGFGQTFLVTASCQHVEDGTNNFVPMETANVVNNTTGTGLAGAGILGYDGTDWQSQRIANVFKTVTATAANNTAGWTPASGKKVRLMKWRYTVTGNATQLVAGTETITLFDGAATAIGQVDDFYLPSVALNTNGQLVTSPWMDLGNGVLLGAANNVLNVNLSNAFTAGSLRVQFCGTEE